MRHACSIFVSVFLFCTAAFSGTMVRVIDVRDGRTLLVDNGGQRSEVTLAGVEPYATTRGVLIGSIAGRWVTLEHEANGGVYVWRSPDGTLINESLIASGDAAASSGNYAYRAQFQRAQANALLRASVVNSNSAAFQQSNVVVLGELDPYKPNMSERSAQPKPAARKGGGRKRK